METYINNGEFVDRYIDELIETEKRLDLIYYFSNAIIETTRRFDGQVISNEIFERIEDILSSFHDERIDINTNLDMKTGQLKFNMLIKPMPVFFNLNNIA